MTPSGLGSQQVPPRKRGRGPVYCHSSLENSVPLQPALNDSYLHLLIDHVPVIWGLRPSRWNCVSTSTPARLELGNKGGRAKIWKGPFNEIDLIWLSPSDISRPAEIIRGAIRERDRNGKIISSTQEQASPET